MHLKLLSFKTTSLCDDRSRLAIAIVRDSSNCSALVDAYVQNSFGKISHFLWKERSIRLAHRRPNEQRILPQPSLLEARGDVEDSLIDSRYHRRKGVDDCTR